MEIGITGRALPDLSCGLFYHQSPVNNHPAKWIMETREKTHPAHCPVMEKVITTYLTNFLILSLFFYESKRFPLFSDSNRLPDPNNTRTRRLVRSLWLLLRYVRCKGERELSSSMKCMSLRREYKERKYLNSEPKNTK